MGTAARKAFWLAGPLTAAVWLLLAASLAFLPAEHPVVRAERALSCPWAGIMEQRCPLCGLTTAMGLTLRGNLGEAVITHPLGPGVAALCVALALLGVGRSLAGRRGMTVAQQSNDIGAGSPGGPPGKEA